MEHISAVRDHPLYEIEVNLNGEPFEVFNRVVRALRAAGVHHSLVDQFVIEVMTDADALLDTCRRWVIEAKYQVAA